MVEIGTFDLSGGPPGDSEKFLDRGFIATPLEALVAFPQSFGDSMGQSFSGGLGDSLSKTMGFRILYIEAHVSFFLYYFLPFSTLHFIVLFVNELAMENC